MDLNQFLNGLSGYKGENTFNPWADHDERYEIEKAVAIRRKNLEDYLTLRLGKARILLIAEACGYQGGHFSGIAMTCERMLLDLHPVVDSAMVLGRKGSRTSMKDSPLLKPIQQAKGFNEPTDSVVWSACLEAGLGPNDFLLWNIFPFHPYKKGNLLTNRTPADDELAAGLACTRNLLSLTGPLPIFAIGKKSENTLTEAGFPVTGLRHPANGGANIFRSQLKEALK
ncbi:uracil-DNA glycosylase [uncultured Dialister sp.]|uniref:uracil-DNA glycosylase n=1 Tax=uncultured Dialister sp. TaxID=278064 RepID=UPI002638334B|nr:uracil-DNA glycosylase [uncultured Dialister sp.]